MGFSSSNKTCFIGEVALPMYMSSKKSYEAVLLYMKQMYLELQYNFYKSG